ncbi:cysteine hydrolase family protein [Neorhizobium sp. NPDC001467]|uniref:cysteine hydrolase family protein n=1 Tax=Neorhizobium sp. NPDC001467 TaxID=3390595 RepID=UPI003D092299
MQRMFAEDTPWHVGWMNRVLPQIEAVSSRFAAKTVFTRFVPPDNSEQANGAWQAYYRKWQNMTLEHLPLELVDLVAPLARLVPPATVFDKATYSPWTDGRLHVSFYRQNVTSVVVSGGETDVCVLATVLGAIDFGYKVVVLSDAVCSGADATHDAALTLLGDRFSTQLDVMTSEQFMECVD